MRGITLFVIAMALSALMGASAKWLAADYSAMQIVFFRTLFAFIPLVMIAGWKREAQFSTQYLTLQILRGLCMLAAISLFFLGLRYLPLADGEAAFAATPLFMTMLAVVFLGERLDKTVVGAVALGLVGALLMSRPTPELLRVQVAFPFAGAVFAALAMVATRWLAQREASNTTLFWGNLVVVLGAASTLPALWQTPGMKDLSLFVLLGVTGGLSTYCQIEACRYEEMSRLAPFDYTGLVWATALGYLIWGDFPDAWTLMGAAAIVLGGLQVIAASRAQDARGTSVQS